MKLILYTNTSDRKKVGKQLAMVEELEDFYWKEDTDILHPIFTFRKFDNWRNFNYCALVWGDKKKFPKWPVRYYFIENFKVNKGGIIELKCSEDYRETWKDWLYGQKLLIARNEFKYNKCIPDDRKVIPLTRQMSALKVGTVGDGGDGTIILTVSG